MVMLYNRNTIYILPSFNSSIRYKLHLKLFSLLLFNTFYINSNLNYNDQVLKNSCSLRILELTSKKEIIILIF